MYKTVEAIQSVTQSAGIEHQALAHPNAGVQRSAPLVVLAHGRSGDRTSMQIFAQAFAALEPIVLLPEGFVPDPLGRFAWWPVDGILDPSGKRLRKATLEELQGAFDRFGAFIDEAIREYHCDPDLVIGVGFSQGAALVGSLSLCRPELFTGVGMLAGLIPRVLQDEHKLISPDVLSGKASLARYFMNNGTKDRIVTADRGRESRDKLEEFGAEVVFHEDPVAHKVGTQGRAALTKWAESFK